MSRPYISVEIDRNVRSMAKNRCETQTGRATGI
jgi:hypothetical protein